LLLGLSSDSNKKGDQIKTSFMYIDDVIIEIYEYEGLIYDLAETFDNMRKFKMKLNPN
jgi:hypothetical protein